MSRSLKLLAAGYALAATLVFAPSAFAFAHNGEGIWGPTNDNTIMYSMFIIMGLIILMIIVFSMIQSWLDQRKHAKMDAGKPGGHGH